MRTIQSELIEKGHVKSLKDAGPSIKKKITEQLSEKEWKELMGCNRDTFTRKNGAIRRK